jgi:hypothetical protein
LTMIWRFGQLMPAPDLILLLDMLPEVTLVK